MIPRFQHLLIPVDFTHKNRAALDIAFEIAMQNKARVTILHVIEAISSPGDDDLQAFYSDLETRALTEMDTMSQRFEEAGLTTDTKVRLGKRAREIVQFSEELDVDLIVMSSHKIKLDEPLQGWGTLSYQVSILCQCPVLLVK